LQSHGISKSFYSLKNDFITKDTKKIAKGWAKPFFYQMSLYFKPFAFSFNPLQPKLPIIAFQMFLKKKGYFL